MRGSLTLRKTVADQLFSTDPKGTRVDVKDILSVSTMASRSAEGHNMIFMGIKRDADRKNVAASSARIEDKARPRGIEPDAGGNRRNSAESS